MMGEGVHGGRGSAGGWVGVRRNMPVCVVGGC